MVLCHREEDGRPMAVLVLGQVSERRAIPLWSQSWSHSALNPGVSDAVHRGPQATLSRHDACLPDIHGCPRTKIGQLVMRRSSVRIRQGAP
jgi:hypothetical protein